MWKKLPKLWIKRPVKRRNSIYIFIYKNLYIIIDKDTKNTLKKLYYLKGYLMRKILITNDDGIDAKGIIRLAEVAKEYGEVWVIAPAHQRSAASHCITLREPIEIKE